MTSKHIEITPEEYDSLRSELDRLRLVEAAARDVVFRGSEISRRREIGSGVEFAKRMLARAIDELAKLLKKGGGGE